MLTFPCLYTHSRVSISYSRRVFKCLYDVQKSVTHLMRQNRKNMGVAFIQGNDSISFPVEGWIFMSVYTNRRGMQTYGPFQKSRKHLQIRRYLQINAVRMMGSEEVLQFATREHFKIFDSLFGKYVRFQTAQDQPKVGETVESRLHHHMFNMGSGIFSANYEFKRRGSIVFGIDLCYDKENSILSISI